MNISVNTKLIALLGNPLGFSFSPRMQNSVFQELGMDYYYMPMEVGKEHLGDVINGLKHLNFRGFGVTKPNKIEILQYIDEIDELAEIMGSCNTLVNNNGKLKGYNTDGDGFLTSLLDESGINLKESTIFCFGAGGAARACCFAMAYRGAKKLYISSHSGVSCEALANDINSKIRPMAESVKEKDTEYFLQKVKESDVLVNMSGLGMIPYLDATPISKEVLNPKQVCYDATYNPAKTKFLLDAEEVGCKIVNGVGMVVNQGALQHKLWSGNPEPFKQMRAVVEQIVEEKRNTK